MFLKVSDSGAQKSCPVVLRKHKSFSAQYQHFSRIRKTFCLHVLLLEGRVNCNMVE